VVVTAASGSLVASIFVLGTSSDGSASFQVLLSSTAGTLTPADGSFMFNASAPPTASAGALGASSGVKRMMFGRPAARLAPAYRKGN
jgi:hypothetical protein